MAGSERGVERGDVLAQYATSGNVRARASLYQFQTPEMDLVGEVIAALDCPPGGRMLDIGCGWGQYLERLDETGVQAIGLDLSAGMAAEAADASRTPTVAGDAEALPFADRAADRVLAAHVLYHCPDPERAVGELRRVLRPGGLAVVVTNGESHLRRLLDLRARAYGVDLATVFMGFSITNGVAVLERHFEQVDVRVRRGELVVPRPEPIVDYVDSARNLFASDLPASTSWEAVRAAVQSDVAAVIESDGAFHCPTETGIITCR